MSTANFKQDVYAQLARVGKALSSGNRLETAGIRGAGTAQRGGIGRA